MHAPTRLLRRPVDRVIIQRRADLRKADEILKEIEGIAERKFLPIVGPEKGQVLAEVVRETKPKRVLEVGTLVGYSAILMGKELGGQTRLITIEIHKDEARIAKRNVERAKIQPTVEVIVGDAKEVIPKLRGKFDLVFVDAEKSEYLEYLRLVQAKLHKGSTLVADNAGIFATEMKDYLDYVRFSGKYRSRFVGVGEDGLEISVKL
jgi:predicted O-methyltransferase YrrM